MQDVREHVQAPAVGHADHGLAGAGGRSDRDRLVEHQDQHVDALDRELLLAEVRALEEVLELLDPREADQQLLVLAAVQGLGVAAALDRLAQPAPLDVRAEVLDLVGDRAAVDLAQAGQHLGRALARDRDRQQRGGHALERRLVESVVARLEGRVARGVGSEGIQPRREVTVGAERADERACGAVLRGRRLARQEAGGPERCWLAGEAGLWSGSHAKGRVEDGTGTTRSASFAS